MSVQRIVPVLDQASTPVTIPLDITCLYILIRNDLASMCPGKAAAQAAHAANRFIYDLRKMHTNKSRHYDAIAWWEDECNGFGTTITLGADLETLLRTVKSFENGDYPCGIINDPTYPIQDGGFVHHIDIVTTGYIFVADKNDGLDPAVSILKNIPLFAGYERKFDLMKKVL
jgi:peptidyl-tRNA hydrolase